MADHVQRNKREAVLSECLQKESGFLQGDRIKQSHESRPLRSAESASATYDPSASLTWSRCAADVFGATTGWE